MDAFLEAKTKALSVLDDSNKAKNAAYDIDPSKSATSEFINKFLAQKVKASSTGVGPLFNAGSTFLSSAKQGLTGAFISKFAPLSSLSGGLAGGLSGGSGNEIYIIITFVSPLPLIIIIIINLKVILFVRVNTTSTKNMQNTNYFWFSF